MTKIAEQELQAVLSKVFAHDGGLYQQRGFQRRLGFGKKPALVNVDLANAWTQPGNPFSCVGMETIIPAVQKMLEAFRARGLPVFYTTTAYDVLDGPANDLGLWHNKIPTEVLRNGSALVEIDERIKPFPGEYVIVKKRASAFHGTPLAGILRSLGIDTVIVTGTTASACHCLRRPRKLGFVKLRETCCSETWSCGELERPATATRPFGRSNCGKARNSTTDRSSQRMRSCGISISC